jgi:hypothetical protein
MQEGGHTDSESRFTLQQGRLHLPVGLICKSQCGQRLLDGHLR